MKILSDIIKIDLPKISFLDVGAMKENESNRYESLLKKNLIEIVGFEPNVSEYLKLRNTPNEKYLNYCLGDGTEKTLYITKYPGCISLYEPNPEIINLFTGIGTAGNWNNS